MATESQSDTIPDGWTVEDVTNEPLMKQFKDQTYIHKNRGFIRVQPFNQVVPDSMKPYLKKIETFECRESDVWVSSFPKCGTTWTQEMVWNIMHDVDLVKAKATDLEQRVPFFEFTAIAPTVLPFVPESFGFVENFPSPRILKTHLSYEMLPKQHPKGKVIYVNRNPRDCCLSFFKHNLVFEAYEGTFEDYAEQFMNGYCGYFSYMPHVLSYWNQRHQPHVLYITYEEMKDDLRGVIKRVATFLGKTLSDEKISMLVDHLSFENMKKNPAVNQQALIEFCNKEVLEKQFGVVRDITSMEFMRKGKTGGWKKAITGDLLKMFEEWEEKGLKDSDLKWTYDLEDKK